MREIDPEIAAMDTYAPQPQHRVSRKVQPPKDAPADPEIAAVATVLAQEKREAEARAAQRGKPAEGTAPLQVEARRRKRAYVDQTAWGKAHVTPGYVGRWVRTVDREGNKESAQRTDQFHQDGYEFVLGADGQKIRGALGYLMEGPPEAYVDRVRLYQEAHVTNPDKLLEGSRAAVSEINRAAGEHVVSLEVGRDHGSKTITEEVEI